MATEVKVPTLGESITEATLGAWLKQPGDPVAQDEPIASLETDKVAVEVPSPVAGTMGEQLVKVGDTVAVGAVIAEIEAGGAAAAAKRRAARLDAGQSEGPGREYRSRKEAPRRRGRRGAASDPVAGGAPDRARTPSRSLEDQGHRQGRPPHQGRRARRRRRPARPEAPAPAAAPAPPPPGAAPPLQPAARTGERREERVRMTRLRQTVARRLKEAQNTAAMLTTFNDVDMSAVMAARAKYKDLFEKKHGIRLGFMGFFVKAAALAARDVPAVNASIDGEEIVYHDYFDVSVAVSAPQGLVVPVIRDAQALSFAEIEKTIADFGKRAKDGTLTLEEMQGGTFTISNGGVFGSLLSTPIINPPQSAVLGMHRIEERPVVVDGQIVARPMMYLALSYDHRLIDGREAVTFLVRMKEALEDPTRLLIDLYTSSRESRDPAGSRPSLG